MDAVSLSQELASGWITQVNQLSRQLRRQLAERYGQIDLTESRAAVLLALTGASQRFTQTDLANELGLSESSLCGLIERMRSEGLLERERSPLDRRKSVLTLTVAGRERCNVIEHLHANLEAEIHGALQSRGHSPAATMFTELSRCLQSLEATSPPIRRAA
ncbi:MarR family winged helix-turn-helix transcriptional regulator [Planctomicrobium sp. SH661]|uniref:MarR family winged helix-turn-helix transcriptional regulator n=1 Tax=Planctomicrobium sp. SH661 TaxID=3448124 RepID=UPI003F5B75DD